jgi:prepilin-type N-terminal cleavage/methylation domain-containing protein
MTKNNRRISAFSLIEISIVILIIGILVAGVTQSSRLLTQAKLTGAKSLTHSAPVSSIKGLSLWIESTSDESFQDPELDDATLISTWNDLNPQATLKADFTVSGSNAMYKTNIINGLPAICFNNTNCGGSGVVSHFSSADFTSISTASTVFIVAKLPSTLAAEPILSKRTIGAAFSAESSVNLQVNTAANGDWQYCDGATQSTSNVTCNLTAGTTTAAVDSSYIVSIVYPGTSAATLFYQNGVVSGSTTSATLPNPVSSPLLLGATSTSDSAVYFKGYIGEVIIFDRALKNEERQSIENYLSDKWGIRITQS